jgi:tRNA threonylcarbamoyladenosine biosynthesis protein TsaE
VPGFAKQEKIITNGPEETIDFGIKFAQQLGPGDVLTFTGNLGSGKTTCIRGICRGLGVTEHVTSPTFTLINEYKGKFPIYHFDFYRLQSDIELHDLGVDEYFERDGICLIEWPEIVTSLLPENHIEFYLSAQFEKGLENTRILQLNYTRPHD